MALRKKTADTPAALAGIDALERYRAKRNFTLTPEPGPEPGRERQRAASGTASKGARAKRAVGAPALGFVIQKHAASRLHYDFRLEFDGVLWSWAVPKGPSLDPADKRMAVRTEDHPLAYARFEGRIPEGNYGAGDVIVWDRGTWQPLAEPAAGLASGKLAFELHGHKLHGVWEMVRLKNPREGARQEAWLLFKKRDAHARPRAEFDIVAAWPDSVVARGAAAAPAPLPTTLEPQLATLADPATADADTLPASDWLWERKFDGYRVLARYEAGVPRLFTRNGHDWTARMPSLAKALAALPLDSGWLDGEIVVPGAAGAAGGEDFNALQNALDPARSHATAAPIVYWLFDLPWFDGHDLRDKPLIARRSLLHSWLQAHQADPDGPVRFSAEVAQPLAQALRQACAAGREGLIAKRRDAPYRSARSSTWLKLKCQQRQEFVVGGYTLRQDSEREIGSLLLGVHDDQGRLQHAGSVGTGWSLAQAAALHHRLAPRGRSESPFAGAVAPTRSRRRDAVPHWLEPTEVAEVAFAGWTPAGHIRHATFVGLRDDTPARQIRREGAATMPAPASRPARPSPRAAAGATAPASATARRASALRITHGERVIDAASGATKQALVDYVDSVADRLLEQLADRPVALLRAPEGVGGAVFFQKHRGTLAWPGVVELPASAWPGHAPLLVIDTRAALLQAAQMNVIEFHTWNSTAARIDRPDRMIFDLDPGDGVPFAAVREAAQLVRALLDELGLPSWLKTSGGKGLHVVVPIAPRRRFDEVKAFSHAVVLHLARLLPDRFVARSGPKNRVGKIFVDYLRNGLGATTVAAFSPRARPGLGVSMPMPWEALPRLESAAVWTVANAREHLSMQSTDPWAGIADKAPALGAAMAAIARAAASPGQAGARLAPEPEAPPARKRRPSPPARAGATGAPR